MQQEGFNANGGGKIDKKIGVASYSTHLLQGGCDARTLARKSEGVVCLPYLNHLPHKPGALLSSTPMLDFTILPVKFVI